MPSKFTLRCPVRGTLKATGKSKDGLKPSEEFYRVQAIKYLVAAGYPIENFKIEPILKKFGHDGKNSFRSDFAVLDVPTSSIDSSDVDTLLEHSILICEVKRDNTKFDYVKNTQVKPMLEFAKLSKCIGLYWDNIDQKIFWQETKKGKRKLREGPITLLPEYGNDINRKPITFNDTKPTDSLVGVFERIENILHQASFDHERRFEIILQLILTKIFDEHAYEGRPNEPMGVQDFTVLGTAPHIAKEKFEKLLDRAVSFYEKHLPNKVPSVIPLSGDTLVEVLGILAPVRITHSRRDIMQTFYMRFAKDMYRWDLAQFFTPTDVTDFIVDIINPQFGDHVCDPACGSADFLVAAFHIGRNFNHGYADSVWGVDNSANAVQVAVLNMVLNGDGKTNIKKDDSLENVDNFKDSFDIMLCNPPFGTRIVEKRASVLKNYDLGHSWTATSDSEYSKSTNVLASQEAGMLFAEVCVKQAKPRGRIGIILPNGYLGNRSQKYHVFRYWLLKNCKLAGIVSFPRFTFKSSGADVTTSVLFLEKREKPLDRVADEEYRFFVEVVENLGWEAGNKTAAPIYRRSPEDGSYIINEDGDFIVDADFEGILQRIRSGAAADDFSWLAEGHHDAGTVDESWSLPISEILDDVYLTMDPKRLCAKIQLLREELTKKKHKKLGDIVDFIGERTGSSGDLVKANSSTEYSYVELSDIGYGDFNSNKLRGWELPSRGRHFAEIGDIYFGSIWGSVAKWCYIGEGYHDHVFTNGCHRCRVKSGMEKYLVDLVAYMNTEGWATQLRALARGSDGLAEVTAEDAKTVIIPLIDSQEVKDEIIPFVQNLKQGRVTVKSTVEALISSDKWNVKEPEKRPSHIVLV